MSAVINKLKYIYLNQFIEIFFFWCVFIYLKKPYNDNKKTGRKLHKDILFYSNLDDYSNKIVQTLSTKNEKDNFIYICVDDPNIQLPIFNSSTHYLFSKGTKSINGRKSSRIY